MTITEKNKLRLQFLTRVITKEVKHLIQTDERLFLYSFTLEQATQLENNPQLAEQVEAFVSRFGRLQDNLGDKLLPELLTALGEKTSVVIDNLDKALSRLSMTTEVFSPKAVNNSGNNLSPKLSCKRPNRLTNASTCSANCGLFSS